MTEISQKWSRIWGGVSTFKEQLLAKQPIARPGLGDAASNRTNVLASRMTSTAWEKGFLMPELPAKQPWERCLYCSSFDLWQGTLAVCCKRRMVLCPQAHYDRKCNSCLLAASTVK